MNATRLSAGSGVHISSHTEKTCKTTEETVGIPELVQLLILGREEQDDQVKEKYYLPPTFIIYCGP